MTTLPRSAPAGSPPDTSGAGSAAADRRVIALIVAIELSAALGFFAVMTHLVEHLRHDLGLLAGTIGLIMGVRIAVQYALLLPVGAVIDLLGAARAGALACALRAAGFTLLGIAEAPPALAGAAALLGTGGALFHPATQSLMAGLHPARRARGFAAYIATQQVMAVAGPPVGLLVLSLGSGPLRGFALLATLAGAGWAIALPLFLLLGRQIRRQGAPAGLRDVIAGVRAVVHDRTFLLFALPAAPSTLLADHTATVVPLRGFAPDTATLFVCVLAAVSAAIQPWVAARRGEDPWVLRAGFLLSGSAYLLLSALDGTDFGALVTAAVLAGAGNGLLQGAIFQRVTRLAAPGRFGAYFGLTAFVSGVFSSAAGMAAGRLFDLGDTPATLALVALAVLGVLAAAAIRPIPAYR